MAKGADIPSINYEKDVHLCLTCGAYLNLYTPPENDAGIWICCICQARNAVPTNNGSLDARLLQSPILEYRQKAAGTANDTADIDANDCEKISKSATMIVIDANIPTVEVKAILNHLTSLQLENVGLVIFSKMIHVYQIGLKGIASADIYSPTLDPIDTGDEMADRMYFGCMDEADYCVDAFFGTSSFTLATSSDNKSALSRKEILKMKRENRLRNQTINNDSGFDAFDPSQTAELLKEVRKANEHTSHRDLKRCTLEAVLYAVHLIRTAEFKSGRVLLFTNGCCNIGQGSIAVDEDSFDHSNRHGDTVDVEKMAIAAEQMRSLGSDAFKDGIGIDVFCSGNSFLGAQAFLGLVKSSSGYVLSHSSFEDTAFQRNVSYVCNETQMSQAKSSSSHSNSDESIQSMASPHRMNMLNGVIMDVRMSSHVVPKLMHGPGIVIHDAQCPLPNERATFASCSAVAATKGLQTSNLPCLKTIDKVLTQIKMGRLDATSSISVILQAEKSIPENSFVYFQFVTRYIEKNDLVTRISTHRLSVSNNAIDFMQSLNIQLTSCILGKEAAFRSMAMKQSEEGDLMNIALAQRDVESKTLSSSNDLAWTAHGIFKAYMSIYK